MKILFAGCGDIARRIPDKLSGDHSYYGIRRSASPQSGIETLQGNLTDVGWLKSILGQQFDVVIVTLTPDEFTEEAYRKTYLEGAKSIVAAIDSAVIKPKLVIWVSSTSVYGQGTGEWVDERSTTAPTTFSGKMLLQAEQFIQQANCDSLVVRFSGIYGDGRKRLLNSIRKGEVCAEKPACWSNRIHSEDCAGVLAHLVQLHEKGEALHATYLASDCLPVTLHDVHQWLVEQLGITPVSRKPINRANRRCSNQRLLDSGYQFLYPTFKEGYLELLQDN